MDFDPASSATVGRGNKEASRTVHAVQLGREKRRAFAETHGGGGSGLRPHCARTPSSNGVEAATGGGKPDRDFRCAVTQTACPRVGNLTEYGWVIPKGMPHVARLGRIRRSPPKPLPESARAILRVLIAILRALDEQIAVLDAEIDQRASEAVCKARAK